MAGPTTTKVAIITGGASGIGLEVANTLSRRENWTLHLFDVNETAGAEAARELPNAFFHKVDVSSYESLSSAFHDVYTSSKQLDFVFANAGIFEKPNFYEDFDANSTSPPPEPKWPGIDINLKGAINTCYLARHYFRLTGQKDGALVMTASCVGLVSLPSLQSLPPKTMALSRHPRVEVHTTKL
jgi:NAD(P)-dependent dehydrogenase (short-subunit alcohol dehydrogenase family)